MRALSAGECDAFGLDPRGSGRWYRKLSHTKNSYGKLSDDVWLKLVVVDLLNDGSGLGGDTTVALEVVDLAGASRASLAGDAQALLDVLVARTDEGDPWSDNNRATERSIHREMERLHGWDRARTTRTLTLLTREGYVTRDEVDVAYGNKTKRVKGLVVHPDKEIWDENVAPCDPFVAP